MSDHPTLPLGEFDEAEEWRPVVRYEGFYEVSDLGRARRTWATRTNGDRRRNPSGVLKPVFVNGGYGSVRLWMYGVGTRFTIHELVAEAFISQRPAGLVTRHIDGNPVNNVPSNLAWGTQGENIHDQMVHGRHRFAGDYCSKGHEYTPENTMQRSDGGRRCRICKRKTSSATQKRKFARRRAAREASTAA